MFEAIKRSEEEEKVDDTERLTIDKDSDPIDAEMKKSLLEFEAFERERKQELAEIERAIALSLAIEEKRLREAEEAEESMRDDSDDATPVSDAPASSSSGGESKSSSESKVSEPVRVAPTSSAAKVKVEK